MQPKWYLLSFTIEKGKLQINNVIDMLFHLILHISFILFQIILVCPLRSNSVSLKKNKKRKTKKKPQKDRYNILTNIAYQKKKKTDGISATRKPQQIVNFNNAITLMFQVCNNIPVKGFMCVTLKKYRLVSNVTLRKILHKGGSESPD